MIPSSYIHVGMLPHGPNYDRLINRDHTKERKYQIFFDIICKQKNIPGIFQFFYSCSEQMFCNSLLNWERSAAKISPNGAAIKILEKGYVSEKRAPLPYRIICCPPLDF